MEFRQLSQALDEGAAQAQLQPNEVAFSDQELQDEAALKIVLQDTDKAISYLQSKRLPFEWNSHDDLYYGRVNPKVWPGTNVQMSNLSMPLVMEVIENLLPSIHMSFFSDPQPFLLTPAGRTSPEAARAMSKVLCWSLNGAGFKEEIRRVLKSALLYGLGVGRWGWETKVHRTKKYQRVASDGTEPSDELEAVPTEHVISQPTFEQVELRNLLVDPGCRTQDIRKAKYVIQQSFITADDLDALADDSTYRNIPTRGELALALALKSEPTSDSLSANHSLTYREEQAAEQSDTTSADPLQQPLELLEYWTDDRVVTVLQRTIVIRNEENEFESNPFVSCAFIDVLGSMFGFGVARLLSGEQRFQQGVANAWIDNLSLTLNPAYQQQKGMNGGAQSIYLSPGKVVNEQGELKPLERDSITPEALNAISTSEARAQRRVGANGGDNMPSQALRTAEGVQAFSAGVAGKTQYFIEIFADLVFIPVLQAFTEMCKDKLKPSQINMILTEEEGKAFEGDVLNIYNGKYRFEVLSSTKLAARRAMAQMIPLFIQLFQSEPVQDSLVYQNKKVDYAQLVEMAWELAGWSENGIIVDMTPQDQQRAQMMNPAVVRAQADQSRQAQKHQDDLENIEAQGEAKAGVQVVRHLLNESKDTSALAPNTDTAGIPGMREHLDLGEMFKQ